MSIRLPPRFSRMRGFTLIELMVSITLGLLIIAALGSVFVAGNRSYRQDERLAGMNDELRFAMAQLTRDIEMTGYWTQLFNPASVQLDPNPPPHGSLTIANDCGPAPASPPPPPDAAATWTYGVLLTPIAMADNATGASANAAFPCIDAASFQDGTDIIAIKRVAGNSTVVPDPSDPTKYANRVFLRTNGTDGVLYRYQSTVTPPVVAGTPLDWEYVPSIYFIRNYTVTAGDGIPSLCRKYLDPNGGNTQFKTDCFAQGIENMQIEYGIDANADGSPDFYVTAPDATQLTQTVSVRVMLLARSVEPVPQYVNQKTYRLSNAPDYSPNDRYYRRVVTTVIGLRNPSNLGRL